MGFIIYDIIFLAIFAIFLSIFLYRRKENLKREGLLLLYKTNWGIKLINRIGERYKRLLRILGYISIGVGFILMILMIYLFGKIIWVYLFSPEIVKAIKMPPIMPLIPYLPKLFNLDFLPPFYFVYWIIIIALIAIPHELAHGIYSAYSKVKIKNTGFGFFPYFLPIFLAAFVEPDEEQMTKKSKFKQMAILSSGTFANVLTAILFLIILWGFFSLCFVPAGVVFDSYSISLVNVNDISKINNSTIENLSYGNLLDTIEDGFNEVQTLNKTFLLDKELLKNEGNKKLVEEYNFIVLYDNSPALRTGINGAISEIEGVKIDSREKLAEEILKNSPGDTIIVQTFDEGEYKEYNITLGEHPENGSIAWLGIGIREKTGEGIMGKMVNFLGFFKKPSVYYYSSSEFATFIYNLLWWIVLICFSVALINMLPIGLFDGGRFFFLAVAAVTRSEKIAKKTFIYLTYLFLALLALIMIFWVKSFI